MTIWQSIALISPWQAAYALGLAGLFWWRGPSPIAWILLADFVAILATMAAMDFGWLTREPGNDSVTRTVLVIWCLSVALLALQSGPGWIMAAIGAVAIPLFAATLVFGVQVATTSAIVNALSFTMLAVAFYGLGGHDGDGGRNRHGLADRPLSLGHSAQGAAMAFGGVAQSAAHLSPDRGRLK